jgi:hypothetical protein
LRLAAFIYPYALVKELLSRKTLSVFRPNRFAAPVGLKRSEFSIPFLTPQELYAKYFINSFKSSKTPYFSHKAFLFQNLKTELFPVSDGLDSKMPDRKRSP